MKNKAFVIVFIAAFISGFSIFLNTIGVKNINPFVLTFSKNLLVGLLILGVILSTMNFSTLIKEGKTHWKALSVVALIGGCIPFLLFFKGLTLTTAASGGFIQKTLFLFSCLLAIKFLKEKVNPISFVAGLLILVGNAIALKFMPSFSYNIGDLLILGATMLWAVENTISKKLLNNISVNTLVFFRLFLGSLLMIPFLFITGEGKSLFHLQNIQMIWIAATALILLAYNLFWYNGLKRINLSTASIILVIASPITTLLTFVGTGTTPNFNSIFGNIILIAAIGTFLYFNKNTKQENVEFAELKESENN